MRNQLHHCSLFKRLFLWTLVAVTAIAAQATTPHRISYGIDGRCMASGKISSHGTATLKVNCNEGTPLIIMMGNQAYKVVK